MLLHLFLRGRIFTINVGTFVIGVRHHNLNNIMMCVDLHLTQMRGVRLYFLLQLLPPLVKLLRPFEQLKLMFRRVYDLVVSLLNSCEFRPLLVVVNDVHLRRVEQLKVIQLIVLIAELNVRRCFYFLHTLST